MGAVPNLNPKPLWISGFRLPEFADGRTGVGQSGRPRLLAVLFGVEGLGFRVEGLGLRV